MKKRRKEEHLAGATGTEARFTVLWSRTAIKAFNFLAELASVLEICFSFLTFTTRTALPEQIKTFDSIAEQNIAVCCQLH